MAQQPPPTSLAPNAVPFVPRGARPAAPMAAPLPTTTNTAPLQPQAPTFHFPAAPATHHPGAPSLSRTGFGFGPHHAQQQPQRASPNPPIRTQNSLVPPSQGFPLGPQAPQVPQVSSPLGLAHPGSAVQPLGRTSPYRQHHVPPSGSGSISISPRQLSISPHPPPPAGQQRRHPSIAPHPSHISTPSYAPALAPASAPPSLAHSGHGHFPSHQAFPTFAFGTPPIHPSAPVHHPVSAPPPTTSRPTRPTYTPLKLANHNSTPSVALDPASFAASLVKASAQKASSVTSPQPPQPQQLVPSPSMTAASAPLPSTKPPGFQGLEGSNSPLGGSGGTVASSLPSQSNPASAPMPAPLAALVPAKPEQSELGTPTLPTPPTSALPTAASPTAGMPTVPAPRKAPQYTPLKLSGHNSRPSVALDPLAFAVSLQSHSSSTTSTKPAVGSGKVSTIAEEDSSVFNKPARQQVDPDEAQQSEREQLSSVDSIPAATGSSGSSEQQVSQPTVGVAHHKSHVLPTTSLGAIQVTASNPHLTRRRYVVSLPEEKLLGSSSTLHSEEQVSSNQTSSSDDSFLSTPSERTSSDSENNPENQRQARRVALRQAWRPRVPLPHELNFSLLTITIEENEPPTSADPAPIAAPIGLVEAATDAATAAEQAANLSTSEPGTAQALADAQAAAEQVAAEEAHESALEHELAKGRAAEVVYTELGLPETIDIFLPGQVAWDEYRVERQQHQLALQTQLVQQFEQMNQMNQTKQMDQMEELNRMNEQNERNKSHLAQLGLEPQDMPPLPSGEDVLGSMVFPNAGPPANAQADVSDGPKVVSPVVERPMNRPPAIVAAENLDTKELPQTPAPNGGLDSKWRPPWSKPRDISPTPSTERRPDEQQASPQGPTGASSGPTLSFLQRLQGAAKRASLSLTSTAHHDVSPNAATELKSPLRSPNPEESHKRGPSVFSAFGFRKSPQPVSPQLDGHDDQGKDAIESSDKGGKGKRPVWQALSAGFGYDVENQPALIENEHHDVDLRTNPSEDGDTSSVDDDEPDSEVQRPMSPDHVAAPMFNSGSSLNSKHAPRIPSKQLNAAAPSFTPGKAPSASFTFVAPRAAPKMPTPPPSDRPFPVLPVTQEQENQGREKRFRAVNQPDGTPVSQLAGSSSRQSGSIPILPNLFAPPPSEPKKLAIRRPPEAQDDPQEGKTLPPSGFPVQDTQRPQTTRSDQQQSESTVGDAVSAVSSSARAGLSRSLGPQSGSGPNESSTASQQELPGDDMPINLTVDKSYRGHSSNNPSQSSDRVAAAAKLNQAVRTATQRHTANLSSASIGSYRSSPLTLHKPLPVKSDAIATSAGSPSRLTQGPDTAQDEDAEAEDIVEQIVARVEMSLDTWANKILHRVEVERAASAMTANISMNSTQPLPARPNVYSTPSRSILRGTPLAPPAAPRPGAPNLFPSSARSAPAHAMSSSAPGLSHSRSSSAGSPDVLNRVEQGVRDTFNNYLKRLPMFGSTLTGATDGSGTKGGTVPADESPSRVADQSADKSDDADSNDQRVTGTQGELDFDYVEETLRAKVSELEVEVLDIVTRGFKQATQPTQATDTHESTMVPLSMSAEDIGQLADLLDVRVRETLETAQVELLRVMAQPSPAVMSVLGDTEAAISAHADSFLATQQTVHELLQSLPAKFDVASETLAGAGRGMAEQVRTSVVDALQPQLEGLRANSDRVDGEVLAARVISTLVPMLEGRHDELPDRIAEAVAGHLRSDLRAQIQMQMQAHLQAQLHDVDAAREAALRRLVLPPASSFAPHSVDMAESPTPSGQGRDSDSFDIGSITAATTVADAASITASRMEAEDGVHSATDPTGVPDKSDTGTATALTPQALDELAKTLASELRASGLLSLDPIIDRLDPLVSSQDKTWQLGQDLLSQQGELASTLRALPASFAAKTDVFLTATRETHQTQKVILERLVHVADANQKAQARISELEDAAAKRSTSLAEAHKAQANVTAELKEAKAELSATNKYMATLKDQVDDLENRLETARANATTATEQLRDAHSRLRDAVEARHAAERSGDDIRRRMAETEAELARAQSAASLASARADDARAALERERKERTTEREVAQKEVKELQSRTSRLTQETQGVQSRLDSWVEEAQKIRSQASEEVSQAKAQAAKTEGALSVAQERVKEVDAHSRDLVQALAIQKQAATTAQQRLTDAERRASALPAAQRDAERLQTVLSEATEQLVNSRQLEEDLSKSRANEKQLREEVQHLHAQFEAVESEVASMKESFVSKDVYDEARHEADAAHRETQAVRNERDDFSAQLDALRAEMATLKVAQPAKATGVLPQSALPELTGENTNPTHLTHQQEPPKTHALTQIKAYSQPHVLPSYHWSTDHAVQEDEDGWWS